MNPPDKNRDPVFWVVFSFFTALGITICALVISVLYSLP